MDRGRSVPQGVVDTIAVGAPPRGVAVTPDGTAYTTDSYGVRVISLVPMTQSG